jgi:hypothetical protein
MKEILSIRYPLVYPSDVLEPLATAITVTTLKAISISANKLKLFKAYWPNDKKRQIKPKSNPPNFIPFQPIVRKPCV